MATKFKDDSKQQSSLLLQPPRSGFSWDGMNNSAILMPISQKEDSKLVISEDSGEIDSFVNQTYGTVQGSSSLNSSKSDMPFQKSALNSSQQQQSCVFEQSLFPTASTVPANIISTGSVSQPSSIDYSLPSSVVSNTEIQYSAPSSYFSSPANQTIHPPPPFDDNSSTSAIGPPTGGPKQDFRRKGPAVYAPLPNFNNLPIHQSVFQPPLSSEPSPVQLSSNSLQPSTSFTINQDSFLISTTSSQQYADSEQNQTGKIFYQNYKPIQPHWFYMKVIEKREIWLPFSMLDSVSLEEAYKEDPENAVVATDGGRYDVFIGERLKKAVYWKESPSIVRRCTWFYRTEGQNRFVPYEEEFSNKLEEHFKSAVINNLWHQRLEFPGSETIVMDNANVVWHFMPCSHTDEWGNVLENQVRPRIVKRGISDFVTIEDGEPTKIDHLVFVVHGVGAVCDMRFRTVIECVDDIRSMASGLMESHFRPHIIDGRIGRVEFLPVSWHSMLHSEATGIDRRLKYITLSSIPKLRHFINDTILDIPFYCSPVYCQTIISAVGSELNRLYDLFKHRNPRFSGNISVVGHSLGSLILFDILAHQINLKDSDSSVIENDLSQPSNEENLSSEKIKDNETLETLLENLGLEEYINKFQEEKIDLEALKMCSEEDIKELSLPKGPRLKLMSLLKQLNEKKEKKQSKNKLTTSNLENEMVSEIQNSKSNDANDAFTIEYAMGIAGVGPRVNFPKLKFEPSIFFALGSPISMFLTVRGLDKIGEDYKLPTCPFFYNIFHPFDPVAYRVETLIDPSFELKPVLVPHHKGRKRMHLEIKESLSRMGADLKQRLLDPLWNTWNSLNEFARAHRFGYQPGDPSINSQDNTIGLDLQNNPQEFDDTESTVSTDFNTEEDVQIGQLNAGKRIDYVLQEKPIESLNEYLFALGSHACYWESEDTILMIVKKIYALMNIFPVVQGPRTHQIPLYNPAMSSQSRFTDISPSGMSLSSSTGQLPQVGISPTQSSVDTSQNTVPNFPSNQPQSQNIRPPPLSGFIKASPIIRR